MGTSVGEGSSVSKRVTSGGKGSCVTTEPNCVTSSDYQFKFGPATVPGSAIFYRTNLSLAFVNKKPVVPGHVLVCPLREGVARLVDLTKEEVEDLFNTVKKVDTFVQLFYALDSTTVSIQNGPLAGQSIPHVHVHILPRRPKDFED